MSDNIFSVPKGYVCTASDFAITFAAIIVLAVLCYWFLGKLVCAPLAPKSVVLKEASVANISGASKRSSYLYLVVGGGQGQGGEVVIEVPSSDVKSVGLYKGQELFVAVDPEANDIFIWGVYDHVGKLIVEGKLLVSWYRGVSFKSYFMMSIFALCFLFGFYRLVRYAVWNGFYKR